VKTIIYKFLQPFINIKSLFVSFPFDNIFIIIKKINMKILDIKEMIMSNTIKFKADSVCNCCGKFGAYDLGDEHLCSDCYREKGSCCLEFGGHDLWDDEDNDEKKRES
jgi:hypothetical protein